MVTFLVLSFFIVLMVIFKDNVFYLNSKCTNLLKGDHLVSVHLTVFLYCTLKKILKKTT